MGGTFIQRNNGASGGGDITLDTTAIEAPAPETKTIESTSTTNEADRKTTDAGTTTSEDHVSGRSIPKVEAPDNSKTPDSTGGSTQSGQSGSQGTGGLREVLQGAAQKAELDVSTGVPVQPQKTATEPAVPGSSPAATAGQPATEAQKPDPRPVVEPQPANHPAPEVPKRQSETNAATVTDPKSDAKTGAEKASTQASSNEEANAMYARDAQAQQERKKGEDPLKSKETKADEPVARDPQAHDKPPQTRPEPASPSAEAPKIEGPPGDKPPAPPDPKQSEPPRTAEAKGEPPSTAPTTPPPVQEKIDTAVKNAAQELREAPAPVPPTAQKPAEPQPVSERQEQPKAPEPQPREIQPKDVQTQPAAVKPEQVVQKIEQHILPAAEEIVKHAHTQDIAVKTTEAVKQVVQEAQTRQEVPQPKEIREVIKAVEAEPPSPIRQQVKAEEITQRVIQQVREDIKALTEAAPQKQIAPQNEAVKATTQPSALPERIGERIQQRVAEPKGTDLKSIPDAPPQKVAAQIKEAIEGRAVSQSSTGGDAAGKKSDSREQAVQKILNAIEKELKIAATNPNGEKAVRAVESIKEILNKTEALTPKQVQEILKAISSERPQQPQARSERVASEIRAQIQKDQVEIVRDLLTKASANNDPKVTKLIEKIERELKSLEQSRPNSEATAKAFERIKELVSKQEGSPTPEQLQKLLKAIASEKVKPPLELAKQIEEMTKPPMTKQEAMQAIMGLLVDTERLANGLVKAIKVDTETKIGQIQANIDELLKIRVEQFIALTAYQEKGFSAQDFQKLMQETLQELATRYGLTEEQRMLLQRIMVALSSGEFKKEQQAPAEDTKPRAADEKLKQEQLKLKEALKLREATPEELEKARLEEIKKLEEMLKEREEIKQLKAERKLKDLMKEETDPDTKYMIDEFLDVIKVYIIRGRVFTDKTKRGMKGVTIVGGLLGSLKTDDQGYFQFANIPEGTVFMIGPDSSKYTFKPEFVSDTLTASAYIEFRAVPIKPKSERKVSDLPGNKHQLRQAKRNIR